MEKIEIEATGTKLGFKLHPNSKRFCTVRVDWAVFASCVTMQIIATENGGAGLFFFSRNLPCKNGKFNPSVFFEEDDIAQYWSGVDLAYQPQNLAVSNNLERAAEAIEIAKQAFLVVDAD